MLCRLDPGGRTEKAFEASVFLGSVATTHTDRRIKNSHGHPRHGGLHFTHSGCIVGPLRAITSKTPSLNPMPQQFWHIRRCSLFEQLQPAQLELLEQNARMREFNRGESVYLPLQAADSVFLLCKGRVRMTSTTPEGKLAILGFIQPGEVFGELALLEDGPREERAEAVVKSTIVMLSGRSLQQLMNHSASLTMGVSKLMGLRRRQAERRLRSLLFCSNRTRLIALLYDLLEQQGLLHQYESPDHRGTEPRYPERSHASQSFDNGASIGGNGREKNSANTLAAIANRPMNPAKLKGIQLSHQDLASLIGSTRESVTHLLGQLQMEGIVQCGRQKIIVRDLAGLKRLIRPDGPAEKLI